MSQRLGRDPKPDVEPRRPQRGLGGRKSKCKRQMSTVKTPTDCHSVRFYGGGASRSEESRPFGKRGQALPRRRTRFLVAPLLGMTSSRRRRSCALVVQRIGEFGANPGLHLTLCSPWPLWLTLSALVVRNRTVVSAMQAEPNTPTAPSRCILSGSAWPPHCCSL